MTSYNVPDAAKLIGVSPEAIRKRLRKRRLRQDREPWALERELLVILDSAEARAKRLLDRLAAAARELDDEGKVDPPLPTIADLPSIEEMARQIVDVHLTNLVQEWYAKRTLVVFAKHGRDDTPGQVAQHAQNYDADGLLIQLETQVQAKRGELDADDLEACDAYIETRRAAAEQIARAHDPTFWCEKEPWKSEIERERERWRKKR